MAEVHSLGIRKPTALPYLIAEGLLPAQPKTDAYTCQIYVSLVDGVEIEEEILATKRAVVWSQGQFVRNVYRFDLEGEDVAQAVLADFPNPSAGKIGSEERHVLNDHGSGQISEPSSDGPEVNGRLSPTARALVVVLKTKLHVYYIRGGKHIVDLPFDIDRIFAAPIGIILQRKRTTQSAVQPSSPHILAPPNSYRSSQPWQSSASFLNSPSLQKAFGRSSAKIAGPGNGITKLDALFEDLLGGSNALDDDDDVAALYSLTDPISELGVITSAVTREFSRSAIDHGQTSLDYEGMDPAERVIYCSTDDEVKGPHHGQHRGQLYIIVTVNDEIGTFTIWHIWYLEEKTLRSLYEVRDDQRASVLRRRSSFVSTNLGTGAVTPATRPRDGARQSFAAAGRPLIDTHRSIGDALSVKKKTKRDEEEAMASQLDPDYQLERSQRKVRDNRRISSMTADVRAIHERTGTSLVSQGGRRYASFGTTGDRRSIGHRRSRGSTPGSVFGRSVVLDDESMDLDQTFDTDMDDDNESVLRNIKATLRATDVSSVFGSFDDTFQKEVLARKICTLPLSQASEAGSVHKLYTIYEEDAAASRLATEKLSIYWLDVTTKAIKRVELNVRHYALSSETSTSSWVAIPSHSGDIKSVSGTDIVKLRDRSVMSVLIQSRSLEVYFPQDDQPCLLPPLTTDRLRHPYSICQAESDDRDSGKNRTISSPTNAISVAKSGSSGAYDSITSSDVHHRRCVKLRPQDPSVQDLLAVCKAILPTQQRRAVQRRWCQAYHWVRKHPNSLHNTASSLEMLSLVAAIFVPVIDMLTPKARAALNMTVVATKNLSILEQGQSAIQRERHTRSLISRSVWSWMSSDLKNTKRGSSRSTDKRQDQMLTIAASVADNVRLHQEKWSPIAAANIARRLMVGLHIYREELKLSRLMSGTAILDQIAAVVAQLGIWLNLEQWSPTAGQFYSFEGADEACWLFLRSTTRAVQQIELMPRPVSAFEWFERCIKQGLPTRYLLLGVVHHLDDESPNLEIDYDRLTILTPRLHMISQIIMETGALTDEPVGMIDLITSTGMTSHILETLPQAIGAPLKEAIARCEKDPPTTWSRELLNVIGRHDLTPEAREHDLLSLPPQIAAQIMPRNIHDICQSRSVNLESRSKGSDRHAISRLIFNEDRRYVHAVHFMDFNRPQIAECPKQREWDDNTHWEVQRRLVHWVAVRMIALPAGHAMIYYDSQFPLLTERFNLPGFNSSCIMLPMHHTLTTDRAGLTEEKLNWAYFHAGVSAGLSISRNAKGIDTSWIAFNKPPEPLNRHAGCLLALGLNRHLKSVAKWLSFKFLTPKHTMTSVGLLLGLSASNLGSMDSLVTRMLSVHITRMLPPGAAELNVSAVTQTAGLMGIGLLYYNTQHRRMSEVMLSEIEHLEPEDPDNGPELLRDESYRLAAGFALGLINLGKGSNLRGLHGMHLSERLLAIAIGSRPIHLVHVLDRATTGAVIALALIHMKTNNHTIARKIGIPDTEAQFEQVRPDMLMFRIMAKHLILWDGIKAQTVDTESKGWIQSNLPACYASRMQQVTEQVRASRAIKSVYIPLFNLYTGLAWALSLKYAGSGSHLARDEIIRVYDMFHELSSHSDAYFFDSRLGRASLRRCIDSLALSVATVMAGSGDLTTFRYLRRLHGRTDSETTYGSHLAAHLAIGTLFLGGGTYTFSTSNLAIAALICAFYPLFPTDPHDNRVHLQAFRHFWTFAAEARCIIVEDFETRRPVSMPIILHLRDNTTTALTAPCLLPDLDTISSLQTNDPAYWHVTLDFASSPSRLAAFRRDARIFVRRCPAAEAHATVFGKTLAALNNAQSTRAAQQIWNAVFTLPVFREMKAADVELILPVEMHSSAYLRDHGTVVDDRLVLGKAARSSKRDALWDLRMLFAWAEKARERGDGRLRWLGNEMVEELKATIESRVAREVA